MQFEITEIDSFKHLKEPSTTYIFCLHEQDYYTTECFLIRLQIVVTYGRVDPMGLDLRKKAKKKTKTTYHNSKICQVIQTASNNRSENQFWYKITKLPLHHYK